MSEENTVITDAATGAPNAPYPPYIQLDMQIAGLRAQLMVAEEQLRRTEDILGSTASSTTTCLITTLRQVRPRTTWPSVNVTT